MPLEAECGLSDQLKALQTAVKEGAVRGTGIGRQRIGIHRKTVVLARDVDALRFNVFHRVIGAVMAELHLEGLRTDGEPHDLMTEADAEKRQLGRDGLLRHLNGVCAGRRIAGTV